MNSTLKLAFGLVGLVFALLVAVQMLVPGATAGHVPAPATAAHEDTDAPSPTRSAAVPSPVDPAQNREAIEALRDLPTDPSQAAAILQNYKPGRMPTPAELGGMAGAGAAPPPQPAQNAQPRAGGTADQPSFKAGEPMIDPTPR